MHLPSRVTRRLLNVPGLLWLLLGATCAAFAAEPTAPLSVAVTNDEIIFTFASDQTRKADDLLQIAEILPQIEFQLSQQSLPAWKGVLPQSPGAASTLRISRHDGNRDRLFSKFQLQEAASGQPIGDPQWVTDFSRLPVRDDPLPFPVSKKGVTCIVDVDDAARLGVTQANYNFYLNGLVDLTTPDPELYKVIDGQKIGFNKAMVEHWDRQLRAYRAHGFRVTAILLNGFGRGDTVASNPMLHPGTDVAHAPTSLGAFNVVTAEGMRCYRAVLEFLLDRYTRPGGPDGTLSGMVIGNELQSHWVWYNQGLAPASDVLRDYHVAVRVADLVARSYRADFPIYLSLDHHWQLDGTTNPLQGTSGRYIVEAMNAWSHREGNFPWQVAFHPYPESLFEPVFWHDRTAAMSFDSPRITFKNLEVLPAFLAQEPFLYHGLPRHVALTEQGFNCPPRPDGEDAQAAAYVYAYRKVALMPTVDSFLYHRHVDANEGGLHLGLREAGGAGGRAPLGRARHIWEVMQAAETPAWDVASGFALSWVGFKDWSEAKLAQVTVSSEKARLVMAGPVYDFCARIGDARTENTLAFRAVSAIKEAGWMVPAIMEHPNLSGEAHAVFTVQMPKPAEGKKLVLVFGTAFGAATADGVKFRVLIDGQEIFAQQQASVEFQPHEVDVSALAGGSAKVDFVVDPLSNNAHDEALWAEPRLEWR